VIGSSRRATHLSLTDVLVFWAVCVLVSVALSVVFSIRQTMQVMDGALCLLSLAVVAKYVPGIAAVRKFPWLNGSVILRAGLVLSWLMNAAYTAWRLFDSLTGSYLAMDKPMRAIIVGGLISAAMAHIIAIGMIEGRAVRHNVCWILWPLAIGATVVFALQRYIGL
jgi:hypothetical protein